MLDKIVSYFRKHKFNLDEFITTEFELEIETIGIKTFFCKKCGKSFCLERWQMEHLPGSMSRGCPGKTKS